MFKKKKQAKKLIFAPKIALRVKCSDPARNHQLCSDFLNVRLQCSQLLRNWAKIKAVYRRAWGELGRDIAQTTGLNCSMTHSPGKFGKKCFLTLQGTMSHRPMTNTSSLKIAAA